MSQILAPLDWSEIDLALDKHDCEQSFRSFVQGAWHILEPATPFVPNWHIDAMCEHAQAITEGQLRKLIVNVPPGAMKSLIWSVMWPVWDWLRYPSNRFLTGSYADVLSLRDSLKSRRLIQSRWFQHRWGEHIVLTGDQNVKSRYENTATGYRIATHVGGATGERANRRLMDDPHNIEQVESDTQRESVIDFWRHVWSERESDPLTSSDVIVMQRLHDRDLCGFIIEEVGGYEHLILPMHYDPARRCVTSIGFTDPRQTEGELLWKDRWTPAVVAEKEKRLGSYGASGQLEQRPSPEAGGIFKRHWWKYWQYPGQGLPPVRVKNDKGEWIEVAPIDLPYVFDEHVQSWDMTFKDVIGTDFVVGQEWARRAANCFLLDQDRDRRDFPNTLQAVRAFNVKWKQPGPRLVEDKANGPAVIAVLRKELTGLIAVEPYGTKEARAQAYAYAVEAGNVFLPHPQIATWVHAFIEEAIAFPNAAHDDQVDTMSQALDRLLRPEEPSVAITPEYTARFHRAPEALDPVPGLPSFRFWYQGLYPCCIIGQILPSGRIILLDCLLGEQNSGIEELIDRKVVTVLAADYRGCTDWRDVTNHPPLNAHSDQTEHHLDSLISTKLDGAPEPGEPDFFTRINAIKGILLQTGRLVVNPQPTPGELKPWMHEALSGGFAYRQDVNGVVSKTEGRKFHPLTSVGEALGHGLSRIFLRKPIPPPRRNLQQEQKRATSYSVG